MRPRARTAGLIASAAVAMLALTTATSGWPGAGPTGATWHGPAGAAADPSDAGPGDDVSPARVTRPANGPLSARAGLAELTTINPQPPLLDVDRGGRLLAVTARPGSTLLAPAGGTDAFVQRYAAAFGVPTTYQVRRSGSASLPGGDTVLRYQQQAGGLPVIGGELTVTVARNGGIRGALAEATAAAPAATGAKVSAERATTTALAEVAREYGAEAAELSVAERKLWLYDPRLIGAPGRAGARPTWWVKVAGQGGGELASVLVDGLDGSVSLRISEHRPARNRIVCDLANTRIDLNNPQQYECTPGSPLGGKSTTRKEGGATSSVAEVNRAYDYLGATYDFFQNSFGRDSYDNRGGDIRVTVRACHTFGTCPYPNAFWEGRQMVFGAGFVTDDVVAHEYAHAVTDYSSQLFYAYESGAINEAISDILGEFVDQSYAAAGENTGKLWLIGEDLPADSNGLRELRDMADPNRLWQPETVGGTYWANYPPDSPYFDNGGVHTNSGPANRLAYLIATGGVGTGKSAQLWYRTAHQLPSGADYNTLGQTIYGTCLQLVGHLGFTRDNCRVVQDSINQIGTWSSDVDTPCWGGSSEDPAVFADDMEKRDRWTFSGSTWQYIPSPEVAATWASSGKAAIYGYGDGTTGYATMRDSVVVPTGTAYEGPYLTFQVNNPAAGGGGVPSPVVQYDAGAGWQTLSNGGLWFDLRGYQLKSLSLKSLVGKTVKFRFKLDGNHRGQEWLIDDVKLFSCDYVYWPARFATGTRSGDTAEVTWVYDSMPKDHIELSYQPAIPGAPTSLPGLGVNQSEVTRSVSLTGLDPDVTYTVSIVIVDDQNRRSSRPVTVVLAARLPEVCATQPPLPFVFPAPRRPAPVPEGECGPLAPPPRR